EQIRQALRNLFAVAAAGGFAANEVVLINVLLTDVGDFPVVNDAYAAELPDGHRPARMTFQAAALPLGAKVEVQGFARHA
ncbi:MAG: RidA family protein, partial [Actinobacteria bacterium]|nr:RidA family protein [Actinomycetota bacterium]